MAHCKTKTLATLHRGLIHQKSSVDNCRILVIFNPLRTSSSRTVSLLPARVYVSTVLCFKLTLFIPVTSVPESCAGVLYQQIIPEG